jgi:membrane-bound metal-dependent hydrolase YbcI (DUF457 family)
VNRATHRLAGAVAGLGVGLVEGWEPGRAVLGVGLSVLVSGGVLSPDMDQYGWWRFLDRWVPDEVLGRGGPLQHRGITHWWGLPVLVLVWLVVVGPGLLWPVLALLAGWGAHLVGDLLYGAEGPGRGPGIPMGLWWGHRGVGWHSGGRGEVWVARPVLVVLVVGLLALSC